MAIITISRGTYSGGKYLAESLAERLGYRCLSREELLENAANQYRIPEYALNAALDNKPGFPEGMNLRRIHYIAYVRAAFAKQIKNDDVVYHGQVGHLLLTSLPGVFKVRAISNMEFRIVAAMRQHRLNREKAIDLIKKVDRERAEWAKTIYNVDWEDPSQYDLVVDLGNMRISEACDQVIGAVRAAPRQVHESLKILDDFAQSTDIRARIAAHSSINDEGIEIEAEEGIITITGKADSAGEMAMIMEIVGETRGVKGIKSDLRVRNTGMYASFSAVG